MSSVAKKRIQVRRKRKIAIRKRISGTAARPRVTMTRSHKNIYAQVVDDDGGNTLLASNGQVAAVVEAPEGMVGKCASAYNVGRTLADKAKEKGITAMVFDRSGYLYHGRIAALARGLRDGGIEV
ncbi:MAG: large subunit ribosomal protein L18 [Candidatus Krumholzibacteriia bacterium]|jgi:large subunit ribosomal protein L18